MSERPLSLAFFDPARRLHGTARAGMTLLFEGGTPATHPEGPEVERGDGALRARLEGRFDLVFEPLAPAAELGGVLVTLCAVSGSVGSTRVDCLGTATETVRPPAWDQLDAMRAVSALFDREHALLALSERPRGALGHGVERVVAKLVVGGQVVDVEDARISTVYDAEGRQRSAGLELWLPGEDFPRRASGQAQAGASLTLEGLQVNEAVFGWRMEGREGCGAYEIAVRDEGPEAA